MTLIDSVQWAAFAVSVTAAWMVASQQKQRRRIGFWVFLASNLLWVVWGVHASAYGLIALQVCLGAMNIRGLTQNHTS